MNYELKCAMCGRLAEYKVINNKGEIELLCKHCALVDSEIKRSKQMK